MKLLLTILFNLCFFTSVFSQDGSYKLSNTSDSLSLEKRHRILQIIDTDNHHYVVTTSIQSYYSKIFTINHYGKDWELINTSAIDLEKTTGVQYEFFQEITALNDKLYLFTQHQSKKDSLRLYAYEIDNNSLEIGGKLNYNSIDVPSKINAKYWYLIEKPHNNVFSSKGVFLNNQGQYLINTCNYVDKDSKYYNDVSVFDQKLNLVEHFYKTQFTSNQIVKQVQYVAEGEVLGFYITPSRSNERHSEWETSLDNNFQYTDVKLFRIKKGKQQEVSLEPKDARINNIKYVRLKNGDIRVIGVIKNLENQVNFLNVLIDGTSFEIVNKEIVEIDNKKLPYPGEEGISEQDSLWLIFNSIRSNYLIKDITPNEDGSFYFIAEQYMIKKQYVNRGTYSQPNMSTVGSPMQRFGCLIVARVNANGEFTSVQYLNRSAVLPYYDKVGYENTGYLSRLNDDNTIQIFTQETGSSPSFAIYNCYVDGKIEKNELKNGDESFNNCKLAPNVLFKDGSFTLMNYSFQDKYNLKPTYSFFTFSWLK